MSMSRQTQARLAAVEKTPKASAGNVSMQSPLVRLGMILRDLVITDASPVVINLVAAKVQAAEAHAQSLIDTLRAEAESLEIADRSRLCIALAVFGKSQDA